MTTYIRHGRGLDPAMGWIGLSSVGLDRFSVVWVGFDAIGLLYVRKEGGGYGTSVLRIACFVD